MLLQLKETEELLENTLADIQNKDAKTLREKETESLQYVVDFLVENIVEFDDETELTSEHEDSLSDKANLDLPEHGMNIKTELQEEYPEASRYLEEDFLDSLQEFASEVKNNQPDINHLLYTGNEVLQRLKSFSKVSSPSTY